MLKALILLPLLFTGAPAEAGHARDGYKVKQVKAERTWQRNFSVRQERLSLRRIGRQGITPRNGMAIADRFKIGGTIKTTGIKIRA